MKTRLLLTLLLALPALLTQANGTKINGIYYEFDGKTASVTYTGTSYAKNPSYSAYTGSITIPSTVTYYSTTYTVTSIGDNAFYGCSGLKSLTIPNSVTKIGSNAFYGCSSLAVINFPEELLIVEENDFTGTPWYSDAVPDGVVYAGTVAIGIKGTVEPDSTITFKQGTKGIGDWSFAGCKAKYYVFPEGLKHIGYGAFYHCNIRNLSLPETLISLGPAAFQECDSLISAHIRGKINMISPGVFHNCTSLEEVTFPETITSIESHAFQFCNLKSITIPHGVTSIGDRAFNECINLTSITIPSTVESIGFWAFHKYTEYGVPNLLDVYALREDPNGYNLGGGVFADSWNFSGVTLHVPIGSKEAYEAADQWNRFMYIIEDLLTPVHQVTLEEQDTAPAATYYNLQGQRIAEPQKGIVIVRYSDGTSRKMYVR